MRCIFCCAKSFTGRRENRYHVTDEDDRPKYSWERNRPDPSQYKFSGLYGEVVAKLDGHVNGQQFIIDNCKESCILILDHTASVVMDDCESCLVVLGPCKGSVFIRNSTNCAMFAMSQQYRMRDCNNIDNFLFCATKPIIESSKAVRFRPLLLYYDKLRDHIIKASLSPFINNWKFVHDFTPEKSRNNFEIRPANYDSIEHMNLVNNLEKVKFTHQMSLFPDYRDEKNLTTKPSLIIIKQSTTEALSIFYFRCLDFMKYLTENNIGIVWTTDVSKSDARLLPQWKNLPNIGDHIVALEVDGERKLLEDFMKADIMNGMELVAEIDYNSSMTNLKRIAQIQIERQNCWSLERNFESELNFRIEVTLKMEKFSPLMLLKAYNK